MIEKATKKKLSNLLQDISYEFNDYTEELEDDGGFWRSWSATHKYISEEANIKSLVKNKLLDLLQDISYEFDDYSESLESDDKFWESWSEMDKYVSELPEIDGRLPDTEHFLYSISEAIQIAKDEGVWNISEDSPTIVLIQNDGSDGKTEEVNVMLSGPDYEEELEKLWKEICKKRDCAEDTVIGLKTLL